MNPSEQPDQLQWWQRGVVYQIYPRSYHDTNGDGIGDLQGVIDRLDYLNDGTKNSLGIDAIWLSPFYPSPMADFGYDVSDYTNVHPIFGDLAAFDRLVFEAHARGIKVIIDYVPNHTSDQHPWFVESRSSRESPKRDWYLWRDPNPDGCPPNNWGSVFGGGAWEWDKATGQYYFHHFLKEQPDLNWRNPEVKAAMLNVLCFWLDRGVDGFRMDVVGMLLKDPDLRDNPPNQEASETLAKEDIFGRQNNIYNQDLDEVHDIIAEFRKLTDSYRDRGGERVIIGEVWYEMPRWVRYYGERGEGAHLPFNFGLINTPWTARTVREHVDHMEAALPEFAWPNYVLGNHDQPRLASRVGPQQARVAAMLLLTLRGTPTLYYGDEIGLENGEITEEMVQDPQGKVLGLARSRDVARTPMQWDTSEYAGLSTHEPWLPISKDYRERNVSVMSQDPKSILNFYRKLLWLRHSVPALNGGLYHAIETGSDHVFAYLRVHQTDRWLVALNFSGEQQHISIPVERGQFALSTYMDRQGVLGLSTLTLRENEGVLIKLE
jgi:alpha-glucosidase